MAKSPNGDINNFSSNLLDKDGISLCLSPLAFMYSDSNSQTRKFYNQLTPAALPLPMTISPIDMNTSMSYFGDMGMGYLGLDEDSKDAPFSNLIGNSKWESNKSWEDVTSPQLSAPVDSSVTMLANLSSEHLNTSRNITMTQNMTPVRYRYSGQGGRQGIHHTQQNDSAMNNSGSFRHEKMESDSYLPDEEDLSFSFSPSIFSPGVHPSQPHVSHNSSAPVAQNVTPVDVTVLYDVNGKDASKSTFYAKDFAASRHVVRFQQPPQQQINHQHPHMHLQHQKQQQQLQTLPQFQQQQARDSKEAFISRSYVPTQARGDFGNSSYNGSNHVSNNSHVLNGIKQEFINPNPSIVIKRICDELSGPASMFPHDIKLESTQARDGEMSASMSVDSNPVRRKVKPKLPPHSESAQQFSESPTQQIQPQMVSRLPAPLPAAAPAALIRATSTISMNELEENTAGGASQKDSRVYPLPCKCKKSRCLKLYCDCFAMLKYCGKQCSCRECFNIDAKEFEGQRNAAIESIKDKNALAFQTKISGTEGTVQHSAGCHCKQSHCLKKYCECFHGGANCGTNCKCQNCKNFKNSKELQDIRTKVKENAANINSLPTNQKPLISANIIAPHSSMISHDSRPKAKELILASEINFTRNHGDKFSTMSSAINAAKPLLLAQHKLLSNARLGGNSSDTAQHSLVSMSAMAPLAVGKSHLLKVNGIAIKNEKISPSEAMDDSGDNSLSSPGSSDHTDSALDSSLNTTQREEDGFSPPLDSSNPISIMNVTTESYTPDISVGALSISTNTTGYECEPHSAISLTAATAASLTGTSVGRVMTNGSFAQGQVGMVRYGSALGFPGISSTDQEEALRKHRVAARLQQRSKIKLPSPLLSSGPLYSSSRLGPLTTSNSSSLTSYENNSSHVVTTTGSDSVVDYGMSTKAIRCPSSSSGSSKKRKVSFAQEPTYPFFGPHLPETTKKLALMCLDFLDPVDLMSMAEVSSLVSFCKIPFAL